MTKPKPKPAKKAPKKKHSDQYKGMGINRPDERGEQAIRKCLSCGRDFPSEHRGNRMCGRCLDKFRGMSA